MTKHQLIKSVARYLDEWLLDYWVNVFDSGFTFILAPNTAPHIVTQCDNFIAAARKQTVYIPKLRVHLVIDTEKEIFT
jgi:hypothetical protein